MKRNIRKQIIAENEISEIKEFNLGGYPQKVLIDGKRRNNPVVIFLHGGPGSPIPFSVGCRGMFPVFTDHLTMIYWDQLGCGINNHPIDDTFTIEHFVDMSVELIKEIKNIFPNNEMILFGVSWGSILALKAVTKVENLIDRVITYGQILYEITFNEEVYEALKNSKLPAKNKEKLARIESYEEHTIDETRKVMNWIRKYTEGYQCKSGEKPPMFEIIMGLITSPDYTIKDFKAVIINGYNKNKSLIQELNSLDLRKELSNIKIPYRILQGSTDIVTSTKIITHFVEENHNPNITCVVIDNCGHMPDKRGMEIILEELISKNSIKRSSYLLSKNPRVLT